MQEDKIRAAPDAVLGHSDDTRRWAVRDGQGAARFPGLTRLEARAALEGLPTGAWQACLVAVALPVLLSDGAGPHLLDADGNLVLALADHPHLEALKLALGPTGAKEQVGLVASEADGVWRWKVRSVIDPSHRVGALETLERLQDSTGFDGWLREVAAWV
jgi:hypothetical protein